MCLASLRRHRSVEPHATQEVSSIQIVSKERFRPEEIAIRILWANNTKTLTFGHQKEALNGEEKNTFIVLPSGDEPTVQLVSF